MGFLKLLCDRPYYIKEIAKMKLFATVVIIFKFLKSTTKTKELIEKVGKKTMNTRQFIGKI